MAKTRVSSSFARSVVFTLCLALSLTGLPFKANTQSQIPSPGVRTQGPPSPNLPNIDAVRNAPEVRLNKPEPVKAKRCRHWDKKCKDLKEKKTSLLLPLESDQSRAMLAYAQPPTSDWLSQTLPLASPLNLFKAVNRPAVDFPIGRRIGAALANRPVSAARDGKRDADSAPLPHAFASSLLPMTALQAANFETARVEPRYRTGQPGEDLFSGNYNWSLPIVSLPGRAGHDLNLSLVYNSLVWTKAGQSIRFDHDYGWPSPGFRFGFPVFYGQYLNTTTNRLAYVVITPSGEAVEMVKVSGLYETYDAENSSYLRLKFDTSQNAWILTAANGTQFIYGQTLQIKDRNGNRITATFDANGLMDTITDTLGRQILLEYGEFFELLKVKQVWNGVMKTLAQFDYADQQLLFNFGSLYVDNVSFGQTIPVIYQVTLLDNSRYKFEWSGYGQVTKIRRYGGLTFERAWTNYNLPAYVPGQSQTDCPLFTTRTDWAYDWSVPAGVNTQFLFNQSATNPDAATETTAPTLTYGQVTVPDGTVHKQYFYPSPASAYKWRYGLLKMSDTVSAGILRKRAKTNWEQPCGGGTIGNWLYQCNPRPAETNIYDNTDSDPNTWENRRRTTVAYAQPASTDFNLVADVYEYDANATTVLRRTHTDYNQTSTYINRRIIGLPTASFLYDGANALFSKVEYFYDESGFSQNTSATPTQHDSTNYGVSFLAGRANQTTVRRYDVTNQTYVEWKTGYNITGSPTFSRDPRYSTTNAQTTISYTDAWVNVYGNNLPNLNTFAYPTTVTDMDGYSSTMKYDFDLGAVRFVADPKGAVTMSEYDGFGRRWKTTSGYGSASPFYTSLNFDSQDNWVKSYSSIESGQPDFYSITVFDGHDRVRATVSDHPGSSGQYRGVYRGYDTMGRMTQVSNPTEINSVWNPVGDDSAGWAWSFQSYDWQGRPLVSTDPLGKTKQASYVGCGCAGGLSATYTDEMGRKQKVMSDTLGREWKTQILKANNTVYSTTTNTYNVRNQITNVEEKDEINNVTQQTVMTYDGHGRLKTRKRPQEDAATTFDYYADDRLQHSKDARNAEGTLVYNNRGLMTSATYVSPGSVAPTSTVTFQYDSTGQRTLMDDGPGQVTYQYDSLSRLTGETRTFDAIAGKSFSLSYDYNLGRQLKSLIYSATNAPSDTINYARDKAGQITAITGTPYAGVTSYASGIQYRAWGAPKAVSYGSGFTASAKFNVRMQVSEFDIPGVIGGTYTYNDDRQLNTFVASTPQYQQYDTRMNRTFGYDEFGRMNSSVGGGGGFYATFNPQQDAFGNVTNSSYHYWQNNSTATTFTATYQNNRVASVSDNGLAQTWNYDAMGNRTGIIKTSDGTTLESINIDAVGRGVAAGATLDGEGQAAIFQGNYYIRSTMFGGEIITTVDSSGAKTSGRVLDGGSLLAEQIKLSDGTTTVRWHHRDPLNLVARDTEPGQIKRRVHAVTPNGAQIETSEGVNLNQYYSCLLAGNNNPTCTGYYQRHRPTDSSNWFR